MRHLAPGRRRVESVPEPPSGGRGRSLKDRRHYGRVLRRDGSARSALAHERAGVKQQPAGTVMMPSVTPSFASHAHRCAPVPVRSAPAVRSRSSLQEARRAWAGQRRSRGQEADRRRARRSRRGPWRCGHPARRGPGVVHGVQDPGLPAHRDQRGSSAQRFGGQVRDEDAEMAYGGDSVRVIHCFLQYSDPHRAQNTAVS